jgi:hypothetical protein
VVYGAPSTTGRTHIYNSEWPDPTYETNFDQLLRVVLGTDSADPIPQRSPGEACAAGTECASGYCLAGKCASACTGGGDCTGEGEACHTFLNNVKACVKSCESNASCGDGAICLSDDTFITPAGYCVRGGPFAENQNCYLHYHTICATGYCSACSEDPSECDLDGTCTPPP